MKSSSSIGLLNHMVYMFSTPIDLSRAAQSGAMSEHLVRVTRLKQLQKERNWTDAELARQCQRKPQQLNAWWSNSRLIGERLARSLEETLKLPRYWLDERPEAVPQLAAREGALSYAAKPAKVLEPQHGAEALPVLAWGQLQDMLRLPNTTLSKATPRLTTFVQASRAAKFVEMPDDSMTPTVQPGDHLLFDPAEAPRAGDVVLVSIPTGEHFVRLFRPKTAHAWEATPVNEDYQRRG
jgi:SOS-response transcriptional repressor LexA